MMRLLRIAGREYVAYVKTVGFWLSMLMMPVISGLAFGAPTYLEKHSPPPLVAVIDQTGRGFEQAVFASFKGDKSPPEFTRVRPDPGQPLRPQVTAWLTEGARPLSAVAVIHGSGEAVSIDFWSSNLTDRSLERQIEAAVAGAMRDQRLAALGVAPAALKAAKALKPTLTAFSPKAAMGGKVALRDRLPGIVGFGTAMLLWMMILTGAGILLNSVIEEKSNRVLEVLLASASVPEIMFGKILGVAGVTLTVLAVWAGVGGTLLVAFQPAVAADVAAVLMGQGLVFYFLFYLVGGYLMYAAIFTAVGSFCETTREAQTLLGPVMALLTVPVIFLTQAIRRPDSPLLEALSWFPPFTPFLMTARAASEPPMWQVLGTGVLMAATVALVVWISGRAFRAGALSTGKIDLKGLIARVRGGE
ncbi:MAG: ABC transporter permease [Caulobacterales bacterium]|nr:ABC transporter permease [Caulobacterales bacterium]